jgi:hypothetical protein
MTGYERKNAGSLVEDMYRAVARVDESKKQPGTWDQYIVSVYQKLPEGEHDGAEIVETKKDGTLVRWKKVGEYERNYCLMDTFFPFEQNGKHFALYSKEYTATRVMSLPDCKDLCGEEEDSVGFCPVEFYVPYDPEDGITGHFGFVAGCIWGDDSSWKIQYLDLANIEAGVMTNTSRFGYIELPSGLSLKEAISFRLWDLVDGIKAREEAQKLIAAGKPDMEAYRETYVNTPWKPGESGVNLRPMVEIATPQAFDLRRDYSGEERAGCKAIVDHVRLNEAYTYHHKNWTCETCSYKGRASVRSCECADPNERRACSPSAPRPNCPSGKLYCPVCDIIDSGDPRETLAEILMQAEKIAKWP